MLSIKRAENADSRIASRVTIKNHEKDIQKTVNLIPKLFMHEIKKKEKNYNV